MKNKKFIVILTVLMVLASSLLTFANQMHYTGSYNFRWVVQGSVINDLTMWSYIYYNNNTSSSAVIDNISTRVSNYHTDPINYAQVDIYSGTRRVHFDLIPLDVYGMEIRRGQTGNISWNNINSRNPISKNIFIYDSVAPQGADLYLVGWETIFYNNGSIISTKHE